MELLDHNAQDDKVYQAVKQGPSCTTPGSGRTVDSLTKTCSGADEPRRKNGNGTKTGGTTFGMSSLPNLKRSNWIDDLDRKGGNGGNGGATSGMSLPNFRHLNNDDPTRKDDHKGGNGGSGGGRSVPNILNLNVVLRVRTQMAQAILGWNTI